MMSAIRIITKFVFVLVACIQNVIGQEAKPRFRVVVQDARPSVIAISGELTTPNIRQPRDFPALELVLAVEANRRANHIFYAIDPRTRSLIHAIDFPERIEGAAIAKSKAWYLVSGESNLYRVDAKTGTYEVLLENAAGQVAISDDEESIAVLGRFDLEEQTRSRFRTDAIRLGVYHLAQKKWIAQKPTLIMIAEQVFFEDDLLVGVGVGGRVYNRAASSFPCHTIIDLTTKESRTVRGEETRLGRPADDDYVAPPKVLVNRARLSLCRQLLPSVVGNLEPATRSGLVGSFNPLPSNDHSAMIQINRYGDERWRHAVFKISKSGTIEVLPRSGFGRKTVHFVNNVYSYEYFDRDNDKFTDQVTGKEWMHPRIDDSSSSPAKKRILTRAGCLDFHNGKFEMLELGGKVRWQRDGFDEYKQLSLFSVSPSGKRFAFTENERAIHILDSANGKTLLTIARPESKDQMEYRYTRSLCFNKEESQLAILFDREIQVYQIPSGKLLHKVVCEKEAYVQKLFYVAGNWFLSGFRDSRFWEPGKEVGKPINFPDVTFVQPYKAGKQQKLILQNGHSDAAILDVETHSLQARFTIGYEGASAYDPDPLPNLKTVFDDRVLIVPSGRVAQFKLLRADDLSILATIHPIHVNESLGWIAYTEDGLWDSSPGAEKYVLSFQGAEQLRGHLAESRHKKGLLSTIMRNALE